MSNSETQRMAVDYIQNLITQKLGPSGGVRMQSLDRGVALAIAEQFILIPRSGPAIGDESLHSIKDRIVAACDDLIAAAERKREVKLGECIR